VLCGLLALCALLVALPASRSQAQSPKSTTPTPKPTIQNPRPKNQTGWRPALPGYRFQFPHDHASHPAFQNEWWYYTGHLRTRSGVEYGFELTFFRIGIQRPKPPPRSAWTLRDIYFAHFTITDIARDEFHVDERVGRGALGMSGARTDRYEVWIDDWRARRDGERHHLTARRGSGSAVEEADPAIELSLASRKPPVIHGKDGVDQKAAGMGRASHYYSLTRLQGDGTLVIHGRREPVTAQVWMDHEFGSNQLTPAQVGWDWFSLQLDDGRELMLYVMRLQGGGVDAHSNGTLVEADGTWTDVPLDGFRIESRGKWHSGKSGAVYPSAWRLRVPAHGLDLTVTPTVQDQELVTHGPPKVVYWEGSVRATGTSGGRPVSGVGYVELTGYAPESRPPI
jgi:predicted secreted hydrolase